jgi:hypothetical protein
MRGVQATYRMTQQLPQTLSTRSCYQCMTLCMWLMLVLLAEPDLANNIWGVLTVGGERIMYRERDLVTNTVSSLLRGTAGTAVDSHVYRFCCV